MQNFGSKCGFFFNISLKILKKGIINFTSLILSIINMKIILKKLLSQLQLSEIYIFYIYKVVKVVLVGKNKDFMFTTIMI